MTATSCSSRPAAAVRLSCVVAVECFDTRDDRPLMDCVKPAVDGWVRQVQGRAPNAAIVPIVTHSASFRHQDHRALHSRFVDLVGRRLEELEDALNDELAGEWRELPKQVDEAAHDGDDARSDVARLRGRLEHPAERQGRQRRGAARDCGAVGAGPFWRGQPKRGGVRRAEGRACGGRSWRALGGLSWTLRRGGRAAGASRWLAWRSLWKR
jgi:hypothetical protein